MSGMGLMPEIAPEPDAAAMVEAVFRAIAERNELAPWMGASVAVVLLVHLARVYGRRLPLVGRWLDHPVVALAIPLLCRLVQGRGQGPGLGHGQMLEPAPIQVLGPDGGDFQADHHALLAQDKPGQPLRGIKLQLYRCQP